MSTNRLNAVAGTPVQRSLDKGLESAMPAFARVPAASGAALSRHPRDARLSGLSYSISVANDIPVKEAGEWYGLRIESWTYGVQDDSIAIPIMDFAFRPGGIQPRDVAVKGLKIMSRPVTEDATTGARAMSVALFFIHQINAGQVPDCERILNLHRLYPGAEDGRDYKNREQEKGEKHRE